MERSFLFAYELKKFGLGTKIWINTTRFCFFYCLMKTLMWRTWLTSSNHSIVLLSSFRWKLFILLTWSRFILQNPHALESFLNVIIATQLIEKRRIWSVSWVFAYSMLRYPNCTIEYESHHHSPSYYQKRYKSVLFFNT